MVGQQKSTGFTLSTAGLLKPITAQGTTGVVSFSSVTKVPLQVQQV